VIARWITEHNTFQIAMGIRPQPFLSFSIVAAGILSRFLLWDGGLRKKRKKTQILSSTGSCGTAGVGQSTSSAESRSHEEVDLNITCLTHHCLFLFLLGQYWGEMGFMRIEVRLMVFSLSFVRFLPMRRQLLTLSRTFRTVAGWKEPSRY